MYYTRLIEPKITNNLFKGDVVIIYGARQVGKTTLVKKIIEDNLKLDPLYLNCDEGDIQRKISEVQTSSDIKKIIGDSRLIVIDEAQRIRNIGLKLKIAVDNFSSQQIIATGSSSFDLANEVVEPLTGRSREFWLYPLCVKEIFNKNDNISFERELEDLMIYGSYPLVFESTSREEKKIQLEKIAVNYLYKDILKFQNLKSAETVRKLLEALALQVGSEVSYAELAALLGVSKQTVDVYVDILEKAFVIFKVKPFSRNLRKEIGKRRKIFFWDNGIRNALINNLNPISLRSDTGSLWENFVVSEKRKLSNFIGNITPQFFWRTYDGQEIDLVEEKNGKLFAYEIKWGRSRKNTPKAWRESYKNSSWEVVNKENFFNWFSS